MEQGAMEHSSGLDRSMAEVMGETSRESALRDTEHIVAKQIAELDKQAKYYEMRHLPLPEEVQREVHRRGSLYQFLMRIKDNDTNAALMVLNGELSETARELREALAAPAGETKDDTVVACQDKLAKLHDHIQALTPPDAGPEMHN